MWHSYLINLTENEARLENSTRQFDAHAIKFTRIEAVNGWQLDDDQLAQYYDAAAARHRYKYPLIGPEIGCYLSHIEAWRSIVENGESGGIVFEDDFEIVSALAPILDLLSSSDQEWDIAKLYSIRKRPEYVSSRRLNATHDIVFPYQTPTCALGYAITASAAMRLVKSSIPFFRPIDEDHKFFWEKNLKVALVTPSPIIIGDQQSTTGTIGNQRNITARHSLTNRLLRGFKSLKYQLGYKIRLHFHRKFSKCLSKNSCTGTKWN